MKIKSIKTILISIGFLFLVVPGLVNGEGIDLERLMPGGIEGTGTYFEIKDSEYLNVSLQSTEEITILLESVPKTISLYIEASTSTNSIALTIGGLEPNKTYYKFEDSYKNKVEFTTDNNRNYTFTQDLIQIHHIWFQPENNGTVFLPEDCSNYGIWDELTLTCTLTQDLTQSVEITENNITLDCDSYSIDGLGTGNGIYLWNKNGLTIKKCIITNFSYSIKSFSFFGNFLLDNTILSNVFGIYLSDSHGNKILRNNMSKNTWGIQLYRSKYNNIVDNIVSESQSNVILYNSRENTLTGNIISAVFMLGDGIWLYSSDYNTVSGNDISGPLRGVWLLESSNNTISNNIFKNSGILIRGDELSHYATHIIEENTVNGNPLYYYKNASGIQVPEDAGAVIIANSTDMIVKNINASYGSVGIELAYTSNSEILKNTTNSNHHEGILLHYSNNNIFTKNTASKNYRGIKLWKSSNNKIYHDNFIDNHTQAYVLYGVGNLFNDGYPSGGNYWSDYTGVDLYSGPNQDQPGSDGIGDTPYTFIGDQDNYPFMRESGWVIPLNQPPTLSNLNQYKSDGLILITESVTTTENIIVFKAILNDPDNDQVKLQVELREINELFTGIDDGGILNSDFVSPNNEVTITREGLVDGQYHWRTRAIDDKGNTSSWQEFGEEGNVDFAVRSVPLYTQILSPYPSIIETDSWDDWPYADGESSCGFSISKCGCALTSAVMVLRYYDITTAQSGDVNPKTLNEWLQSQFLGYVNGNVNWLEVAKYSNYRIKYDITDSGNKVNDYVILDNYLTKAQPAIVYEKAGRGGINIGHFLVVDNKLALTYGVKDPYFYNTRFLDELTTNIVSKIRDYDNNFDGLRLFYPSDGTPVAAISLSLASPAEFLITDPQGRKLGKDSITGIEYNQIPDASYFSESIDDATGQLPPSEHEDKMIYIENPLDGQYEVKVIGTGSGSYVMDFLAYDPQGQTYFQTLTGNTDINISLDYILNYNSQQLEEITILPQDTEAPVIFHTLINPEYLLNSNSISFEFSAQDSGVGVFNLNATLNGLPISSGHLLNFNTVGTHIIEITAVDFLGNSITKTITFKVIYQFSNFLPPIKLDGSGIYKQGRTLPIKFQLTDVNNQFFSTAIVQLVTAKIQNEVVGNDEIPLSTSAADSDNVFRYDSESNQYIYNLSTDTLSVGTWQLKVLLDDDKYYTVVISIR